MRTGECDFTQQGCMFLHAMPDLDTLELLGFRSYPRWFREMPRDYQLLNAKDFQDAGLDNHRHAQRAAYNHNSDLNWSNPVNRYMPQRNPVAPVHSFPMQSPLVGHNGRPSWPQTGYGQHQGHAPPHHDPPSFGNLPYNRAYTPEPYGNNAQQYHPSQGYHGPTLESTLMSRTTTPSMDLLNRLHKPLSPDLFGPLALTGGSPGIDRSVSLPFHSHEVTTRPIGHHRQHTAEDRNPNHATSSRGPIAAPNTQTRAKQTRRQAPRQENKAVGTAADSNPYSALSIEDASLNSSNDN